MTKSRIFILYSLILMLSVEVHCYCTVNINGKSPYILKEFGSKTLLLRKDLNRVTFERNETLKFSCVTDLSVSYDIQQYDYVYGKSEANYRKLDLKCESNDLIAIMPSSITISEYETTDGIENREMRDISLHCNQDNNKFLYESEQELPNCPTKMSYAIGYDIPNVISHTTAALCYDFKSLSLKYYHFLTDAEPVFYNNFEFALPASKTLTKRITNLKDLLEFLRPDEFSNLMGEKQRNNYFLDRQKFVYEPLVQNINLREELKQFDYLFNIVWWQTLLENNWHHFEVALQERTKAVNYLIYSGTSGIISFPNCTRNELLSFEKNQIDIEAPEYIWMYVKSMDANVTEEFVAIAYNSPFFEYAADKILCKSICNSFEWLQESIFGTTHAMGSMGFMICCHPKDVSNQLAHFPLLEANTNLTAVFNSTSN